LCPKTIHVLYGLALYFLSFYKDFDIVEIVLNFRTFFYYLML